MSAIVRGLVYVLITAIVIAGLWLTQPRQAQSPQGIFLATTTNKTQLSGVIGNISMMMVLNKKIDPTVQQTQLMNDASKLATENGANQIQVQYFVKTMSPSSGKPIYLLKAQAVM